MAFKPSEITKEHVLKGIEEIKKSNKPLTDGTRWEVIINGESYPPKEVMRYARKQYDGSDNWPKGGGWPTNQYLEKIGFLIRNKENKKNTENLEFIDLQGKNIYKFSMGIFFKIASYRKLNIISRLEELNLIVMHINTQKGQGTIFTEKLSIGDFVYVTYGKDKLGSLCKIISDIVELPNDINNDIGEKGYKGRIVEIVKEPLILNTKDLVNDRRDWLPSGNTTLKLIVDQVKANNILFKKYYGVNVGDKFETMYANMDNKNDDFKKISLNKILYGPPGTGKTYKLINDYFSLFEIEDKTITKEEYEFKIISKLNWWQIIALVLLEGKAKVPDIKKHRYVKYKLAISNTNSLDQTLWGQLSSHTIQESETVNYARRIEPLFFNKSADSIWDIVNEKKEFIGDLIEITDNIKNYKVKVATVDNYKFTTFHQSFSYEDFIEGIKPVMDESEVDSTNINYKIEKGIFYNCCNEASKLAGFSSLRDAIDNYSALEREEKFKNAEIYGLFIDEINRGNVSQIFGELITLIEEDKRLGETEIILELPYSKEKFGVPPNLYIIGTMNTADRSIEALDTALRRRFTFEEMPPLYNLSALQNSIYGHKAYEILMTINKRIEKLLDRDHAIGHSYLLSKNENTIIEAFYSCIIPLLQEYFFGDYAKIGLVLGKGFVKLKEYSPEISVFADFDSENASDYDSREVFEIVDYRTVKDYTLKISDNNVDMDFNLAIQLLMKKIG